MTASNFGAQFSAGSQMIGSFISAWGARAMSSINAQSVANQNAYGLQNTQIQAQQMESQWVVQNANASLARAQAAAENTMRDANNQASAAASDMTNWSRSVNNNRLLKAAGETQGAAMSNYIRGREQQTDSSIEAKLVAAEQRGALAAATALSGTHGSSIDNLSSTLELRNQRREFYQTRQDGYANYDAMAQIIGIVPQALAGFDTTVTTGGKDYGFSTGPSDPLQSIGNGYIPKQVPNVSGNFGTDALSWFMNPNNNAANRQLGDVVSSWFTTEPGSDLWDSSGYYR